MDINWPDLLGTCRDELAILGAGYLIIVGWGYIRLWARRLHDMQKYLTGEKSLAELLIEDDHGDSL